MESKGTPMEKQLVNAKKTTGKHSKIHLAPTRFII